MRSHHLQLAQEGMLQCPLPRRLGHMQPQVAATSHGVQAQNKGYVVLQEAGVCVVQAVLKPALGALVVELAPSRCEEQKVVRCMSALVRVEA